MVGMNEREDKNVSKQYDLEVTPEGKVLRNEKE